MSIIIDRKTRIIIQGISGKQGTFHSKLMKQYGTHIVAGVVPGRAGQQVHNIPIYNTVPDAIKKHKADFSLIFVPAPYAKNACIEALDNNLHIIVITENMLVHDVLEVEAVAKKKKLLFIGPNCPGVLSVGKSKVGIMPSHIFKKGNIGIISRSGTLTYEIVHELSKNGLGQSTCVGIGGDPIIGENFIDLVKLFENDKETKQIVMIGEIGGDLEEQAAKYIQQHITKPVVAYIAGVHAPKGKRMGHAGAIITGKAGTAKYKIQFLKKHGIKVAQLPSDVVQLLKQ